MSGTDDWGFGAGSSTCCSGATSGEILESWESEELLPETVVLVETLFCRQVGFCGMTSFWVFFLGLSGNGGGK